MRHPFYVTTLLLILLSGSFFQATAGKKKKANKDTQIFRYEIITESVGAQGTYLVKVYSFSKKPIIATEQAKKNAVHGIIFKGVIGNSRVPTQNALVSNPAIETEKKEFFKAFFANGGGYMKYVATTNSGKGEEVVKVGKEYKVGVTVSVNVSALRKELETAGVIQKLDAGF